MLQNSEKLNVQNELAQLADVSHDTLSKVEKVLNGRDDLVKQNMLSGGMSINAAYKAISPPKPKPVNQVKATHPGVSTEANADPPGPPVEFGNMSAKDRGVDDADQRVSAMTRSIHGIFKELPSMLHAIRAAEPTNQSSLEELFKRLYDEVNKAKTTSIEMTTLWLTRDRPTPPTNHNASVDATAVCSTVPSNTSAHKSPIRITDQAHLAIPID